MNYDKFEGTPNQGLHFESLPENKFSMLIPNFSAPAGFRSFERLAGPVTTADLAELVVKSGCVTRLVTGNFFGN